MKEMNSSNYDVIIGNEKPILIDFFANWCGPCKMLSPHVDKLSQEYSDKIICTKVNVDDNRELSQMYNVSSIPLLVIVKDKKVIAKNVGYMDYPALVKFVENIL